MEVHLIWDPEVSTIKTWEGGSSKTAPGGFVLESFALVSEVLASKGLWLIGAPRGFICI